MTDLFGSSEAGRKGGKAAASKMTAEQKAARARRAAEARWAKAGKPLPPQATHAGVLGLPGGVEIDCFVLEDKSRVISTRGVMKALGRRWRGRKHAGTELPVFLEANNLKPFIDNDLYSVLSGVVFRTEHGARAEGQRAEVLPKVCEVYLRARDAGNVLTKHQEPVAKQAEILMRAFAHVGIIALVDEATGYERDRKRYDLARILEEFVAKELQKWLPTFPLEFYELICRVRGEPLERVTNRPPYFGHITNNVVYERLAPGVLKELRRKNPVVKKGRRKHKHTQFLTTDMGHPRLKEHLEGVQAVLKIANMQNAGWDGFLKMLDQTHPKFLPLPLFDATDQESDDAE